MKVLTVIMTYGNHTETPAEFMACGCFKNLFKILEAQRNSISEFTVQEAITPAADW